MTKPRFAVTSVESGTRFELNHPTALPNASAFLWNRRMMIHVTARGFATAQFMQPEPAKYAHPPLLAAKTFMQPEQPTFAHHPGRFVYVKDEEDGTLFSAPYEPVRARWDKFVFAPGQNDMAWVTAHAGISAKLSLALPPEDPVEMWQVEITNDSSRHRRLSVYPYFPVGYASWMNLSGGYRADLCGIVCSSVTPYQKLGDYFKNRDFKDKTFLLADRLPDAWEANQVAFEGEGGLREPAGVRAETLAGGDALYEVPTCALQYRVPLAPGETFRVRLLFGPARDDAEIMALRQRYLSEGAFNAAAEAYAAYVRAGQTCLLVQHPTPTSTRTSTIGFHASSTTTAT